MIPLHSAPEPFLTCTQQTNGLVEVFDRKALVRQVDICYLDPLAAQPTFLCLLYLVFAIGLVLATPVPGSPEHLAIQRLNAGQADLAEMFFRSAKCLGDPTSGFEDNDFWSVQALLLLSVYMLARTKRNAAYAYHGMTYHRLRGLSARQITDPTQVWPCALLSHWDYTERRLWSSSRYLTVQREGMFGGVCTSLIGSLPRLWDDRRR